MSNHPNVSTENSKRPTTQMSAPKTQNVGTDCPKCATTLNVGTYNSKCWYQPLKMSALITQNVQPPKCRHRKLKTSAPTAQNVRPPKMSAPTTQNVGTNHSKCQH